MAKFFIMHEDYSDSPQAVEAYDSQEAAEIYAKEFDGSLSTPFNSLEIVVKDESGASEAFSVTASIIISYYATKV